MTFSSFCLNLLITIRNFTNTIKFFICHLKEKNLKTKQKKNSKSFQVAIYILQEANNFTVSTLWKN